MKIGPAVNVLNAGDDIKLLDKISGVYFLFIVKVRL